MTPCVVQTIAMAYNPSASADANKSLPCLFGKVDLGLALYLTINYQGGIQGHRGYMAFAGAQKVHKPLQSL